VDFNDINYPIKGAVFEFGIKTVENFDRVQEVQLLNYMKATGIQVGLLVNFKQPKADIKGMVLNLRAPSRREESPFGKRHDG
jgi:hypothetical protein